MDMIAQLRDQAMQDARTVATGKRLMFLSRSGPAFTEPDFDYQLNLAYADQLITHGAEVHLEAVTGQRTTPGRRQFCARLTRRHVAALDPEALRERMQDVATDVAEQMAGHVPLDAAQIREIALEAMAAYEADLTREAR